MVQSLTARPSAAARRTLLTATAALMLLAPSSAHAISYGEPDDGEHPNVGAFVDERTDPDTGVTTLGLRCSGTLVSDNVVLSAAHCFVGLPPGRGEVFFTLDEVIDADRDGVVDPGVELRTGTPVPHPLFGTAPGQDNPYDVAVFLLDEPVSGVAPAPLARLGLLDSATRDQTYTAVGYGLVRTSRREGAQALTRSGRRQKADQHLQSKTRAWVTFSMNQATGNGGGCYGDSGGPHFLGDVVVSVTVTGDMWCKATDKASRLDTPWARDFLQQYLP